jgi:hypothetical protein
MKTLLKNVQKCAVRRTSALKSPGVRPMRKAKPIRKKPVKVIHRRGRYRTAAKLMESCPTPSEMTAIRNDFNITFSAGLLASDALSPWTCTRGGNESSLMLTVYNMFRMLKNVPFTRALDWAPTFRSPYEWLRSLNLTAITFHDDLSYAILQSRAISIDGRNRDSSTYRQASAMALSAAILIHEARHIEAQRGHDSQNKPGGDADMGGAYGAAIYYAELCANDSGSFFTTAQQADFLSWASSMRAYYIG